jgi:hypothetical protein
MPPFDPSTAVPVAAATTFDPSTATPVPPPAPRGNIAELGTAAARGALVDLPQMAGKGLQFAASPASPLASAGPNVPALAAQGVPSYLLPPTIVPGVNPVTTIGQGLVTGGQSWDDQTALQPDQHGPVINALAGGLEAAAPIGAAIAAGMTAAPLALGAGVAAPALAGGGGLAAAALTSAVPFAAQQGQETVEKGEKKGMLPSAAQQAGRLTALGTLATQTGLGAVGGKMFGAFGSSVGKILGTDGAALASNTLDALSGQAGFVKPLLQNLGVSAAENVGLGVTQAGVTAGIENATGVDNQDPITAMKNAIVPMLGMTAVMAPMGLAGRAFAARAARDSAVTLAHPDADPQVRAALADQYAAALAKPGTPFAQEAAINFRTNAQTAIDHKTALPISPDLFNQDAITPPGAEPAEAATPAIPQLTNNPTPMVGLPDGSMATSQKQIDDYLAGFPPDQQVSMRGRLYGFSQDVPPAAGEVPSATPADNAANITAATGLHDQVKSELAAAGVTPTEMMTKDQFAQGTGLSGQRLAQEYASYLNNPASQEAVMRDNAAKHQQLVATRPDQTDLDAVAAAGDTTPPAEPGTESTAPAAPFNPAVGDALSAAVRRQQVDRAYAAVDAQKAAQTAAIANRTQGADLAAAAEAGTVQPDANAPKQAAEVSSDIAAVSAEQGFSTRAQDVRPLQTQLDKLGVNDAATHQEQIDAVQGALDDPKAKIGAATKERMQALVAKWKADAGIEDVAPAETSTTNTALMAPADAVPANTDGARQAALLQDLGNGVGTREQKLAVRTAGAARELAQAQQHPNINPTDHAAELADIQQRLGDHAAIRDQARALDMQDARADLTAAMLQGGKDELDANVKAGTMSPEQRDAAVEAARATGNTTDALAAIHSRVDTLGENIPAIPSHLESMGTNIAAPAHEVALTAYDRARSTVAGYDARVDAGEKLSPEDIKHRTEVASMKNTLLKMAKYPDRYTDNAVRDHAELTHEVIDKTYNEDDSLKHYKTGSPEGVDPAIMFDALRTGKLSDTLDRISSNGSTPEVQALAARLKALTPDTSIHYRGEHPLAGAGVKGEFYPGPNNITIRPGGESEATILHEATHAAQYHQIDAALQIGTPKNEGEAKLKGALTDIRSIMDAVKNKPEAADQYGLTNEHEFLAELNSNPDFQKFLKASETNGRSLWQRAVNAVRKLLNLPAKAAAYLDRAMTANEAFFKAPAEPPKSDVAGFPLPDGSPQKVLFMKSPKDAGAVTDEQLTKLGSMAGKIGKVDLTKINAFAAKKLLGWETVQYIVGRAEAIPEFVSSGLAKHVGDFYKMHEVQDAARLVLEHPLTAFAQKMTALRSTLGDGARDIETKMGTIGGEASMGGFDYKMSYSDNVKAGRDLDPKNKAYVDKIHRDYTQLPPEAKKLLVEGELLNKRILGVKTATVARNMLGHAAGEAVRLQGELNRLGAADPARVALEAQVKGANLESYMAQAHSDKLDFMHNDIRNAANTKPGEFHSGADQALDAGLNKMFAAANALPEGSTLRAQMKELSNMYHKQVANPYFSLGRSGDYFVKLAYKGMDAQTQAKITAALRGTNKVAGNLDPDGHIFMRFDTQDEASGIYKKLQQVSGDKFVEGTSAWGKLGSKDDMSARGVTPVLQKLLDRLHETVTASGLDGAAAQAAKDSMSRQVMSLLPETSSRSASMERKGIPGYSADFLGNFARRANGGVMDSASMYTASRFAATMKGMEDSIGTLNQTGTADGRVRARDVVDELKKRFALQQQPLDNTTINTIGSLGHTFYLAASPSYLIRTMVQPMHRGLPIVGSRYGFVNSAKELGAATPVAIKIAARTIQSGFAANGMRGVLDANMNFKDMGLKPEEETFLQELHDRGMLNLGQSRQLQTMALGGTQRQQDLTRMAGMTAQYAEMTNRLVMALASFRLAQKGIKGVEQRGAEANTEYAIDSTKKAMDDFAQYNTAREIGKHGFAGKLTPLMTAFMNYNLQTMQQVARTVHDGFFSQDASPAGKQRAGEAKKEFAGLFATTAMLAGAAGLPFVNVLAGVYNTLMNDDQDPHDIRIDAEKFLANNFGSTAAGIVMHGLPHAAGIDSSSFGLENLLPGSEFLSSRQLVKDRMDQQSQALLGPAIGIGIGGVNAFSKISEGHYVKGIEQLLPSAIKPYYKAIELATNGYTDSNENPSGLVANGWDVALQAAGFQSAARATQMENIEFNEARKKRQELARNQISDRLYKGVTNNDPSQIDVAVDKLQSFNQKNPTQPITDVESGLKERMTALALGRASGTGVTTNVRGYPSIAQNLLQIGRNDIEADANAAMPRR